MLNMNPVVLVNVSVGAGSVATGVYDVGAILTSQAGTGDSLTKTSRFAVYSSLDELATGVAGSKPAFAKTTDVYLAAEKYFGVNPAPVSVVVIFYETTQETTDSPAIAIADAIDKGTEFYGVYYCPKASETDANIKTNSAAIVTALEAANHGVLFYGVYGTVTAVTTDGALLDAMHDGGSKRAVGLYTGADGTHIYDAAGLMGAAMGLSRMHQDSAFALCYKPVASATVNNISQTEVAEIKALNGNVYVARTKTKTGIENGATASGLRFDEVLYIDRIVRDLQEGIYNIIADSDVKLPQNDSTTSLCIAEVNRIM